MPPPFPGHICVVCACYVEEAGGQITYTELSVVSLEVESEGPERIYSPDN